MYDLEDARDVPTTWREYLRQSKEMFGAIVWAWRDFKTAEALRWYRWLAVAVIIATIFSVALPQTLKILLDGIGRHDARLAIVGLTGFFICFVMQRFAGNHHDRFRECLLGSNMGQLDSNMTERFFGKSIGQHVQENHRLNPESIMTGRERLLATQSLLFFEGVPTAVALCFSYVLLWWLSWVIGLTLTVFLVAYGLYLLYLNQKVLEACTPLEVEWRRLKRYRFERMKNVERVKISAREIDELRIMKEAFEAVLGKDRSFWLWYIRQTLRRGLILVVGMMLILIYGTWLAWTGRWTVAAFFPLIMWSLEIVNNVWRVGYIERQLNWFLPAVRHMIEALAIPPAITSKPDAIVLTKNEPIEICFDGITTDIRRTATITEQALRYLRPSLRK